MLTRIPPEVWLQIIQEASYVPSSDMSEYDPLPPNGSYHIISGKLIVLIREALSTKYTISLVCRLWNNIVVKFLYDFIIVRDAIYIPLLVDKLSRVGTHISQRVQRIDFMCAATTRNVNYNGLSYNAKQLARAAAKLITLCPRLRALSSPATLWEREDWSFPKRYSPLLAKALLQVKDTLECLEWRSPWGIKREELARLILPRLKLLLSSPMTRYSSLPLVEGSHWVDSLTDDEVTDEDGIDYNSPHGHPKNRSFLMFWTYSPLHTVDADYYRNWTPSNERIPERLTFLRHIIISPSSIWHRSQYHWAAIPQVNTITFQNEAFRFFVKQRSRLPPTVHTIVLYAQEFLIEPPKFPYIRRVGLMGTESLAPGEFDNTFRFFVEGGESEDHFPILEMIRFMDTSLSDILRKRKLQLKPWVHQCQSKGVRLEDEMGELITLDHL